MASHTETYCEHSCCNKNFQILLTSDLHQLADDAYENHNYIEYLFYSLDNSFRQLFPLSERLS